MPAITKIEQSKRLLHERMQLRRFSRFKHAHFKVELVLFNGLARSP